MPTPDFITPPEGASEAISATEVAGSDVGTHVTNQLSAPTDVRAAHQYFTPPGVESQLPSVQTFNGQESLAFSSQPTSFSSGAELNFAGGAELNFTDISQVAQSAHSAIGNAAIMPTGAEASALTALPGADAALAAVPGGEPISPIIQLILKMPGHIGLLNSFFEALAALFFPGPDLFSALNPALWMQHAQGAMSSLASVSQHFPISLSLLPTNAPIFQTLGQNFAHAGSTMGGGMIDGTTSLGTSLPMSDHMGVQGLNSADLNVSGHAGMGRPMYEQVPGEYTNPHELAGSFDGQQLAFDGQGDAFRPTLGGMQQASPSTQLPVNNTPPPSTAGTSLQTPASHPHATAGHNMSSHRGDLLDHSKSQTVSDGTSIAQTPPGGGEYTIRPGDNLWDIARKNMGDGTRWQEIYQANQSVLGSNPDLIHPGTHINLPDGSTVASADKYVVQPGDNLWDIAQKQMGGGQNWHEIYNQNAGVIGDNPRLIHPGQELHLGGGSELAHGPHGHVTAHHAPAHHAPAHHAPSQHGPAHHHTPHHTPQHAPAHHAPSHQQVAHNASNHHAPAAKAVEASSQQVPRQLAQTPGGGEQGLKASQQMGSLKDLSTTAPGTDQ